MAAMAGVAWCQMSDELVLIVSFAASPTVVSLLRYAARPNKSNWTRLRFLATFAAACLH